MKLKVLLPTGVLLERDVGKVTLESGDGEITFLERHVDFTTTVVPGVLAFEPTSGGEEFVAVGEGVLVKCADVVLVSTRKAIHGEELGRLKERIREEFSEVDEREEAARTALNKIEATFVHRFIELGHDYE